MESVMFTKYLIWIVSAWYLMVEVAAAGPATDGKGFGDAGIGAGNSAYESTLKISAIQQVVYAFDGYKTEMQHCYPRDTDIVSQLDDLRDLVLDLFDSLQVVSQPPLIDGSAFELEGEHYTSLAMDPLVLQNDWRVLSLEYIDTQGDKQLNYVKMRIMDVSPIHTNHRYIHILFKWPVVLHNRLQFKNWGYSEAWKYCSVARQTCSRCSPVPAALTANCNIVNAGYHINANTVIESVATYSGSNPENPTYRMTIDTDGNFPWELQRGLTITMKVLNDATHSPYKLTDRDGKLRVLRIVSNDETKI
jgi:hypothetical protein